MIWLILGIIVGAVLFYLISGVRKDKMKIAWYQWALGSISVVMLLFTLENYLNLQTELEGPAANFIVMVVGLPALVVGASVWVIPWLIKSMNSKSNNKKITA